MGKPVTLAGPQSYTVEEVIELCEKYAGADADVTQVPVWLLRSTRNALRGFQWARDAADRLVRLQPHVTRATHCERLIVQSPGLS